MGIHDGHRKRLRQRFAQQGADGFQDHELLEYLLQFSLPRVDTNPLAHRLMDRFGSFSSVLDAPVESLLQVEGVGPGTAAFLSALPGVCRRYYTDRNTDIILNSSDRSGRYLLPRFIGRSVETVFLVCMDSKCKVLACLRLSEGNTTMASVDPAQVTREALPAAGGACHFGPQPSGRRGPPLASRSGCHIPHCPSLAHREYPAG